MSSTKTIAQLQAEADDYHDRGALLRAKLYRWGLGSNARCNRSNGTLSTHNGACATRGCALTRDATC